MKPVALFMLLSLAACSRPSETASSAAPPFALPMPSVVIAADPPPPFTYWAPEGATIRNHPNVPGVWQAFVNERNVATYFGDACKASEYQRYVGQPQESFPAPPPGIEVRPSCETCAVNDDLRPNRINVLFNEATQKVTRVACY
jgi:hypothetical protein